MPVGAARLRAHRPARPRRSGQSEPDPARYGIHAFGRRYLDPTLAAFVGEGVVIRYDPATWPNAPPWSTVDQLLAHRTGLPATARELAPPAPAQRRLKIYTEE
ncbi:Mu transposase C-terminal domain-containing protein [Nonomuraea wenchangensis]|uniref:Mu transposase C-terminal domain-containing protein n=1 Tax=Nonomuraea wenchangensis TaxID=568860 RepID=UPI003723C65D